MTKRSGQGKAGKGRAAAPQNTGTPAPRGRKSAAPAPKPPVPLSPVQQILATGRIRRAWLGVGGARRPLDRRLARHHGLGDTAVEITTASASAMCSAACPCAITAPSWASRRVTALLATSDPLTR